MRKKIDLDITTSDKKGLKGQYERLLRRFKTLMHLMTMVPVYFAACLILGFCLVPGIFVFRYFSDLTANQSAWIQNFSYGLSLATGYFLYGLTMILFLPIVNKVIVGRLQEWRGPYYSSETLKWFVHNGLTYLARYTFLEFLTPSPLNLYFYKQMGMKIGRGVTINSTWISDPSLIELGDKVTIGGSVTLVAHYGQGGLMIISPVKIGHGCTIGLKATVMGGAIIGDGAKVMPHSVVMPKSVIPAGEIWGGVPAQKVSLPEGISNSGKVA